MELRGRLPGATALATARPSSSGLEVEVGELVVEQEPAHHLLRAEEALDGRGHRHGVARRVDDGDVARAGDLVHRDRRRARPSGPAACPAGRGPSTSPAAMSFARVREVGRVDEALHRHVDEAVVAHVAVAVREGEAAGLGEEVHGLRGIRAAPSRGRAPRARRGSAAPRCRPRTTAACRRASRRDRGRTAAPRRARDSRRGPRASSCRGSRAPRTAATMSAATSPV